MRVIAAVHSKDGGPNTFGDVVHELGHELVEWWPSRESPPEGAEAALVFGGTMHVHEVDEYPWLLDEDRWLRSLLESDVPVLGVCLGAELLAHAADWLVVRLARPEIGWHDVELTPAAAGDPVLAGAPARFPAFQWHSYAVEPPPGGALLANGSACAQAYRVGERAWGIQFHAEVTGEVIARWLDGDSDGEDAREAGLDSHAELERTGNEIGAWMQLGRGVCRRFLELAERR